MTRIEVDVDDELLGAAAHALGTRGVEDTVRAALEAAARGGGATPPPPAHRPEPHRVPPPGDPLPPDAPEPQRRDFPRPPDAY